MLSFGNFILAVSFILSTEFDKKALETACVIVAIIVMGLFIEVQEKSYRSSGVKNDEYLCAFQHQR